MKYVYGVLGFLVALAAALTLAPTWLKIEGTPLALTLPFGQALAMRWIISLPLIIIGIIIATLALFRFAALRRGGIAALTALAVIAVGVIHAGIIKSRGIDSTTTLPPDEGITHVSEGTGAITVMSYNTLDGATTMEQIRDLVMDNGVDVIVLLETSAADARHLGELLDETHRPFHVFDSGADEYGPSIESTCVLVSTALGEYTNVGDLGLTWGSLHLKPANGNGPDIVAVHPVSPERSREELWRSEITTAYSMCEQDHLILAGDFNSTVDHMRATGANCRSALDGTVGGLGTWPADAPRLLGAPIDNIFSDYPSRAAAIVTVGKSDHRAVIARLDPSGK
ncbi:MAG: hypothetical protein Q4P33_05745 [Flaviflexus sp.]|nr:hypothetical protein [Flaviflexus sp.]